MKVQRTRTTENRVIVTREQLLEILNQQMLEYHQEYIPPETAYLGVSTRNGEIDKITVSWHEVEEVA